MSTHSASELGGGGVLHALKIVVAIDFVCPESDAVFAHASDLIQKGDHIDVLHVVTPGKQAAAAALAEHFRVKLTSRFSKARFDVV